MELEEVLAAAERGPAELLSLLNQREGEITPELAASAEDLAREGKSSEDEKKAFVGALAASRLYLWLGDRPKALEWLIVFNDILYVARNTTENYLSVRTSMLDAIEKAHEIGSAEMAFQAAVLAAEAGFHAGEGAGESDEWRLGVFADIASARGLVPAAPPDVWFQRLVYLIAVAGSEAMTSTTSEDGGSLTQSLRALASWVEAEVPVGFEFDLDSKVNAQIAAQLTELTTRFA